MRIRFGAVISLISTGNYNSELEVDACFLRVTMTVVYVHADQCAAEGRHSVLIEAVGL